MVSVHLANHILLALKGLLGGTSGSLAAKYSTIFISKLLTSSFCWFVAGQLLVYGGFSADASCRHTAVKNTTKSVAL